MKTSGLSRSRDAKRRVLDVAPFARSAFSGSSPGKRIIVTGGAGFVGSHLIERLIACGNSVLCIDDLSTGTRSNLQRLQGNPAFKFIQHDISSSFHIDGVDEIYNLACPASPSYYQADPIQTTRTCVLGAMNVLELARSTGARVLQASTSEVYGDPHVHPQPESYWGHVNPNGPRSCYDEGKRCAESLFFDFGRMHAVSVKVARIFNTYGPRMRPDDGRVVSNFIVQALSGDDLTIYGEGEQTRSFCYVSDLVDGLIRLMESPDSVTGPVNLGNPGEFTIGELAALVVDMTGSASGIAWLPLPIDDPRQRRPDITQARRELDWSPTIALREGLAATIAYFASLSEGAAPSRRELHGAGVAL